MFTDIKTRIALYIRAGEEEQRESSNSLRFQEERLLGFIKSQHDVILEDSHIYKDNNLSGTLPIESRPALKKLFEDGANGEFDVVYVYKLDRFSQKTSMLVNGIDKLKELNVELRSLTESLISTAPMGMYMTTIIGAIIEFELAIRKQYRR